MRFLKVVGRIAVLVANLDDEETEQAHFIAEVCEWLDEHRNRGGDVLCLRPGTLEKWEEEDVTLREGA